MQSEALAVAVYNHYKRINFHDNREEEDDVELQKSIFNYDWSNHGSGKAFLLKLGNLNVPCLRLQNATA